jgi:hypothetical protein
MARLNPKTLKTTKRRSRRARGWEPTPGRRDDAETERRGRPDTAALRHSTPRPPPSSRARGRFRFRHAERRNREGDAPSERRPRDALLMPFMAGNAVAGAAATRVAGALRRTPTVGIAEVMAAMENIVLVLVLRESPSSVARRCASGAFRDRRVYPRVSDVALFGDRVEREINPGSRVTPLGTKPSAPSG